MVVVEQTSRQALKLGSAGGIVYLRGEIRMRLTVIRAVLLACVLCTGVYSVAIETRRDGPCSGIDSRHDCTYLGELSDSVLLAGIFKSCTESGFSAAPGSKEDPDSSVIYQFDLKYLGVVKLDVDGLENASLLKEDSVVFRTDKYMASISHRFEPGRYTLMGRAPLCGNVTSDWNGGYKILIDPLSAEDRDANAMETEDGTGEVVVLTRERRKPIFGRVTKWVFIGTLVLLGVFLLLGLFTSA